MRLASRELPEPTEASLRAAPRRKPEEASSTGADSDRLIPACRHMLELSGCRQYASQHMQALEPAFPTVTNMCSLHHDADLEVLHAEINGGQ